MAALQAMVLPSTAFLPHEVQDTGAFAKMLGFDTGGQHTASCTSIHVNAL